MPMERVGRPRKPAATRQPARTPPAATTAQKPPQPGVTRLIDQFVRTVERGVKSVGKELQARVGFHGLRNNPEAPPPPKKATLRTCSFNIEKGHDLAGAAAEIRRSGADVVCLQEATPDHARALAKQLKMHVCWFSTPGCAGEAILSKYPIESSERHALLDPTEYVRSFKNAPKGGFIPAERIEPRGVLRATIKIGDKTIDVLDTHLSLGDPQVNTRQLEELDRYAKASRARGHEVLIAGDFNTNFAIRGRAGGSPGASFADQTDTLSEFASRYGAKKFAGNIADARNQEAVNRLQKDFHAYLYGPESYAIDARGNRVTPAEARARIARIDGEIAAINGSLAGAAKGTLPHDELSKRKGALERQRAAFIDYADGNSHKSADKRFDNLLSSLPVKAGWIDFSCKASDHQPVYCDVSLR